MIVNEVYTLSNGVNIPKIGLGTWFLDNDQVCKAICKAISIGYRHIDTAQAYGNEFGVGKGIQTCGVDRAELFITSKIIAECQTYEEGVKLIDESLDRMKLDYIDLMLIHSPQPWDKFRDGDYSKGNRAVWKALEEAYDQGKVRAIGVSNFKQEDIENIIKSCKIKPMINQILIHIGNTPNNLIRFCQKENILVEGYSPIAHGEVIKNESLIKLAKRYHVSVPQLCIRYVLQLGALPLPKAMNENHMMDNIELEFEIDKVDFEYLNQLKDITDYGEFHEFPVFSGK